MTRRAFTLLELLVVIAIMGLLGSISIGGYRAMQRGMEERGVMQNANQFIRAAYQRAQIDRQPVAIYFWNETLQKESDTDILVVVGKAVAVRRSGRLSYVQGNFLGDEFGDLRFNRLVTDEDNESNSNASESDTDDSGVYLYRINGNEGNQPLRSKIAKTTRKLLLSEPLLAGLSAQADNSIPAAIKNLEAENADIECYAYRLIDKNGVEWKVGDAYGFEFAEIQLPKNYIFGSNYSQSDSSPIAGEQVIRFKVSQNSGSGANQGTDGKSTIEIYVMRPDQSGGLSPKSIGQTDSPTSSL